jgi:hypothetical protein
MHRVALIDKKFMSYGLESARNDYFEALSQGARKTTEDW